MRIIKYAVLMCILIMTGCGADGEIFHTVNYSKEDSWIYFDYGDRKPADCFIVGWTDDYISKARYLYPDNEYEREKLLNAVNRQMGVYTNCCKIYSPTYHQDLSTGNYNGDDYSYNDIRSAFAYYMQNCNNGRPLILAGYAGSADMLLRLMKDELANEEYADRLVAAYLIGTSITQSDIADYPHIRFAQAEQDTGVVVSFISEGENTDFEGERALSINPLTWTTDSAPADETFNMGACFVDENGGITDEIYQFCGAYIDDKSGALKIMGIEKYADKIDFALYEKGYFTPYDLQFFYRNLEYNVEARIDKFDD